MQIEQRSIEFIPESERHGNVRSLFPLWFSANSHITTVVTGALAIKLGLSLWQAVIAIILGNAIGGIFMALQSAQGPKLGIPQMIQSRAQFGIIGAIFPLVLVIMIYVGFFSTGTVFGAEALSGVIYLPYPICVVIVNVLAVILVIYGYDFIHRFERIISILFFLLFIYLTFRLLQHPIPVSTHVQEFSWGPFLLVLSIMASWQLTYGPYAADYSRYLPTNTSQRSTFLYTYLGSVFGASWLMIIGALATVIAPKQSAQMVSYLAGVSGSGLITITYIITVLGVLAINTLSLYGGFMSVMTTVSAFSKSEINARNRILFILILPIIGTFLSIWGQGNFLDNFFNFLLVLLYFMIPWSAINIVDFYLVRKGKYNVNAVFDPNGEYGRFNWGAIAVYVFAVLVQFPFMNTSLYVGPIAKYLNGADIAWIVGLIAASVLYYFPMKKKVATYEKNLSFIKDTTLEP
ncbi:cytosine permease [Bacillus sp. AFS073361]|uniref:purine-cytosine permease family protein n=1 Tax=Bacillus sp. AFS073361 TaxID=2033511 RepID=UPI000BFA3975|nr:cytosine permease [Bacillus sp. AFS073361]PFP17548.1 cytosine permease [Bacillus sp. AFS073361]